MSVLPKVGRWIKYYFETDIETKYVCKVKEYEDCESFGWTAWGGGFREVEHHAVLEYPGGDIDSEDKEFFRRVNWTYIPEPTEEELATAVLKRNNRLLGYFCQSCKSTSVKLLLCKGCEVVHYCDRKCQRADWPTHEAVCEKKKKVVLQPNPRYPLDKIRPEVARKQRDLQIKANAILMDALNGCFEVLINDRWVRNPKATDLETCERYILKHDADQGNAIHFKHRALNTGPHANGEPTSCSLYMTIELVLEGEAEYKEGGLHYLALDNMDPGMFWGMALNFNTFGTVAPFTTKCHCNFPKMPPSYKKLKKQWDKIFTRAKKSGLDVQCMFADTPIGCHSFGLDGEEGCKFKHDVSVKMTK